MCRCAVLRVCRCAVLRPYAATPRDPELARTRGAINLSPRPALLMSRYFRYAAKEQSGRSVSAECCVSSTGPPPPVIPLDLDRQRRVVDDRALAFEVEFRNVAGEATAIGSAGPYTLVVDRPTDGGGRGLGFNGGQLLYLAIGGVHLERSVQGGGNARHPPHNCSGSCPRRLPRRACGL